MDLYNKNSQLEEERDILKKKVEQYFTSLEEVKIVAKDSEDKIDSLEKENRILLEEKIALSDTFNKHKFELKDKDSKLFEATEKLKLKELERVKMSHRIEGCEAKIKEN